MRLPFQWRSGSPGWLPEPVVPPFPGVSPFTGRPSVHSAENAMQTSGVWACVYLISNMMSMLPASAYTWKNGQRVPASVTPSLLAQPTPDPFLPFSSFIRQCLVSLTLRGNFYAIVTATDLYGYITEVQPLHPDRVTVQVDPNTAAISYRVGGKTLERYGAGRGVGSVMHLKAFDFPGSPTGMSVIGAAMTKIATDLAVGDFAYGFFRDGAHPSAVLSVDKPLNKEQADTTKARFMSAQRGREPAILSGGVQYKPIQINPEESQFLATQRATLSDIARFFCVRPGMIGGEAGGTMTYQNVEQAGLDFLSYTLQPWITLFEEVFSLLLPNKMHVRLDTSVIVRTDLVTTMTATSIGIASKQMTPDEARAMRDQAPLTQEQKALLDLIPITVGPTGTPKPLPGTPDAGDQP